MEAVAVVVEEPKRLAISKLGLTPPSDEDVVVATRWSGISTGTERLLWSGRMPDFPGMGYPLVPGYETVGEVVEAGAKTDKRPGDLVFVPGAQCYWDARGLFGGGANRLVTASHRTVPIDPELGERGVLLALAATAYHALRGSDWNQERPDLIVGHGVLGRLLARLAMALGGPPPTVWETERQRADGAEDYRVCAPEADERRDYRAIYDVSGDAGLLDSLIQRLTPGGEIVLAGLYEARPSFAFPPAFMREVRFRVAAEWQPEDLRAVKAMIETGALSLDGLITHHRPAGKADDAYRTAFGDPACLKMILDWSDCS